MAFAAAGDHGVDLDGAGAADASVAGEQGPYDHSPAVTRQGDGMEADASAGVADGIGSSGGTGAASERPRSSTPYSLLGSPMGVMAPLGTPSTAGSRLNRRRHRADRDDIDGDEGDPNAAALVGSVHDDAAGPVDEPAGA